MRLTRYSPSAWWRKRHCPGEPEPWELSPHTDALLPGSGLWPIKVSLYISRWWDQTRKRKKSLSASMLGRHDCNKIVKQALAGSQQKNNNKLQYAYQGLTEKKGPQSFREDTGKNPRSSNSRISSVCSVSPSGTVLSATGSKERFSAVKEQLHNASSLWMVEELFIQTSCD